MSGADGLFLEACGATGPLELACDGWEGANALGRAFDRPAVLVGRNPAADFRLDHPSVGRRHVYLQVVEGRLFAIDLDSRGGIRWSGVPRASGWVDADRPLALGPTTIRVVGGLRAEDHEPGPGPTSRRFEGRHRLAEVALEVRGADGRARQHPLDRVLATVGRSPLCAIRLSGPGASHFACALVRTPRGVWVVDLLSSRGVTVNGATCRHARLEDGDVLGLGERSIRLIYGAAARRSTRRAAPAVPPGRVEVAGPPAPLAPPSDGVSPAPADGRPGWELLPDLVLRQIQEQDNGPLAGASQDQAMMMLVRLLGAIYKGQLDTIREEAEQIRRLDREIAALRAQAPPLGPAIAPDTAALPEARTNQEPTPAAAELPPMRPGPQMVQALVGERIEAWERERQSRWRKVIGLLVKPS